MNVFYCFDPYFPNLKIHDLPFNQIIKVFKYFYQKSRQVLFLMRTKFIPDLWNFSCLSVYPSGFNGQERDDEIAGVGNFNTALYWEYDTRLGRRWNVDPKQVIGVSSYEVNANNPIYYIDPNGDFRTKFGAKIYKFFHGGEIGKATGGYRAGEYFVGKQVSYSGPFSGVTYQRTFGSKVSSGAEYIRGGLGAAYNFHLFLLFGGGNETYKEGSFEADEMATSPGVQKGLAELRQRLTNGEKNPVVPFKYEFSPDPNKVLNSIKNLQNPLDEFSAENKEAHLDVFKDQSFTKLFVGGYGKGSQLQLIGDNTVKVIIKNNTTANSFLLHGGEKIFGKENGAKRFNDLWNKTPFLNTQSQTFEFTVPLNK